MVGKYRITKRRKLFWNFTRYFIKKYAEYIYKIRI